MKTVSENSVTSRLDASARIVTAALSSRVLRGRDTEELLGIMDEMPGRQRAMWMAGVLGLLFALALVAAQIGVWGLAVYFLSIVLLIR